MSKKFLLSFYKTVLCKFFQTRSKNRVIENRVMENRVKRGNTVISKNPKKIALKSPSDNLMKVDKINKMNIILDRRKLFFDKQKITSIEVYKKNPATLLLL